MTRGAGDQQLLVAGPSEVRVLLVDDDRVTLACVSRMLQACEYQVDCASCARVALEMLRQEDQCYDLVLSDVYMPDMDGFKLLEVVGLEMDLPVIMMSSDGETSTILQGVTHGAVDFLIKPVRMEELRPLWQHVLRRRQELARDSDTSQRPRPRPSAPPPPAPQPQPLQVAQQPALVQPLQQQLQQPPLPLVQGHVQLIPAAAVMQTQVQGAASDGGSDEAGVGPESRKRKGDTPAVSTLLRMQDSGEGAGDMAGTSKKPRVVWSAEMHQQFVNAVNQLGVDKAVPKKILELMGAEGKLTRENVASHLQKYRLALKRVSTPHHGPMALGIGMPGQHSIAILPPPMHGGPIASVAVAAAVGPSAVAHTAPVVPAMQVVSLGASHVPVQAAAVVAASDPSTATPMDVS